MVNLYERLYIAGFAVGIAVLFGWLLNTRLGRDSLINSTIRRNNMPIHFPFIFFFLWIAAGSFAFQFLEKFFDSESLEIYIARTLISLLFLAVGIYFAKRYFVRGLIGFGLKIRKIPSDIFFALLNTVSVIPVIVFGISAVIYIGKLIYGEGFAFDAHQSLVTIKECDSQFKLIIMLIMIVLVTPAFEEILFRGFFQSMLLSQLQRKWLAIILTSGLFTILHQPMHWLAIFPLSLCLGYSYEKSSSIFRPIFIHILFNLFNTISILCLQ